MRRWSIREGGGCEEEVGMRRWSMREVGGCEEEAVDVRTKRWWMRRGDGCEEWDENREKKGIKD